MCTQSGVVSTNQNQSFSYLSKGANAQILSQNKLANLDRCSIHGCCAIVDDDVIVGKEGRDVKHAGHGAAPKVIAMRQSGPLVFLRVFHVEKDIF